MSTTDAGHIWGAGEMARDAAGFAACEAQVPTGFDDLCRWMGYVPERLRKAIGSARTRGCIMQAMIHHYRVSDLSARKALADAFIREVSVSLDMGIAAE